MSRRNIYVFWHSSPIIPGADAMRPPHYKPYDGVRDYDVDDDWQNDPCQQLTALWDARGSEVTTQTTRQFGS